MKDNSQEQAFRDAKPFTRGFVRGFERGFVSGFERGFVRGFEGFKNARAIFVRGYDGCGNYRAGFLTEAKLSAGDNIKVAICAGTFYRLYVNGEIAAHGPARAAEGYLRADVIDVSRFIREGRNCFAFEVSHYGEPFGPYSNDVSRVKALLMAEIYRCKEVDGANGGARGISGGCCDADTNSNSPIEAAAAAAAGAAVPNASLEVEIIDATSASWKAIELDEAVRHAERISHCREAAENYYIDPRYEAWRTDPALCDKQSEEVDCPYTIIERGMALPPLTRRCTGRIVEFGEAQLNFAKKVENDWFCGNSPEYFKAEMERPVLDYRRTEEISARPGAKIKFAGDRDSSIKIPDSAIKITDIRPDSTAFLHYDLGQLYVGFISITVNTASPCVLDIVHLESYSFFDNKEEVTGGANPVTRLHLPAGTTKFTSFEPACVRYLKLYLRPEGDYSQKDGNYCGKIDVNTPEITINSPEVIEYTAPDTQKGSFQCSNDDINRLYEAARRTLRLNTLDIFMDCPERERGGWLCDSLWTARAFRMMMGDASVERAFIENFLLTDPEAMWHAFFPESYPGLKGDFKACPGLLTWSFWLMIELPEYVRRTGDGAFAEKYRKRVEKFVDGSLGLRGESGLLENLPWIFIDWSMSNEYCRPISTAANALYARMLIDLGQLYGNGQWTALGEEIRGILRKTLAGSSEKPMDIHGFFPDALEFKDGQLIKRGNYSESAQYTMIWSGLFTKEELPRYIWRLVHTTGPDREFECDTRLGKAGLFIGLCIRLDMLAVLGEYEKMYSELQAVYFPNLREGPGTLWETQDVLNTSRCHGFSSHAGVLLTRDILGLGEPDEVNKTIKVNPHPCGLRWARGTVNTSDGLISLSWKQVNGGEPEMILTLPDGWKAV